MIQGRYLAVLVAILWACCQFYPAPGVAAEGQNRRLPAGRLKLDTDDLLRDIVGQVETYPTYTTQLINIANRNAQSTRARYVGQMSELVQNFPGQSYGQWVEWYTGRYPDAIEQATDRTYAMIEKMRRAMADIDRTMVHRWIRELVLAKSYVGLRFQKSILKALAAEKQTSFRLAAPKEESRGIDGYIGAVPVSIKPLSYRDQPLLQDPQEARIVYYEKVRGGLKIYYTPEQ